SGWRNPGLKALLEVAGSQGPAGVFHAGYILGPRINAGGRVGPARPGARPPSTGGPAAARALGAGLDAPHASRAEGEREVTEAAIAHIERESNQASQPLLLAAADD